MALVTYTVTRVGNTDDYSVALNYDSGAKYTEILHVVDEPLSEFIERYATALEAGKYLADSRHADIDIPLGQLVSTVAEVSPVAALTD